MTKEVMEKALEALETTNKQWKSLADSGDAGYWKAEDQDHYQLTEKAIKAIKEALKQEQDEPVAWVSLTDEEIFEVENAVPDEVITDYDWCIYFAKAIEAKLKEKNA